MDTALPADACHHPQRMSDVPEHLAEAVATVRAFASASGAERVVLLLDRGESRPATMLDGGPDGTVELTEDADVLVIDPLTPLGAPPRELPGLRPPPASAMAINAETGELEAPIGAIANLARAVLALATAFGGRTVASVDFPTRDADVPLTIAAREGDPLVVAAGDARFELPWEALG
jgi:hypothetical protein